MPRGARRRRGRPSTSAARRDAGARLEHGHRAGLRRRRGSSCTPGSAGCRSRELFEPAIGYGREGFLVSPTIAGQWAGQVAELKDQPGFAEAFLPGGRAPRAGRAVRLPEHAAALGEIAADERRGVLSGRACARAIEAHAKQARWRDARRPTWPRTRPTGSKPLEIDYRGYTLHEIPPNGQGIVALIALGMLEHFDMRSLPVDSAPTACTCRSRR